MFVKHFFSDCIYRKKIKRRTFITDLAIILVCLFVGIGSGFASVAIQKIITIYGRITGSVYDQSAIGHKRYYSALLLVFNNSSPVQIFFGYGAGCSGYPIDVLYAQFPHLKNWSVESDFMNILYSWGISGFVAYYSMLLSIMFRGWKIDKRYTYLVLIVTLQGITYNVQFEWVQLIMIYFYCCTRLGIDFFDGKIINNYGCNNKLALKGE